MYQQGGDHLGTRRQPGRGRGFRTYQADLRPDLGSRRIPGNSTIIFTAPTSPPPARKHGPHGLQHGNKRPTDPYGRADLLSSQRAYVQVHGYHGSPLGARFGLPRSYPHHLRTGTARHGLRYAHGRLAHGLRQHPDMESRLQPPRDRSNGRHIGNRFGMGTAFGPARDLISRRPTTTPFPTSTAATKAACADRVTARTNGRSCPLLGPHILQLRQPLSRNGQFPGRRPVETRPRSPLGILPLVLGCMAYFGREIPEGGQLDQRPEATRRLGTDRQSGRTDFVRLDAT